MSAILEEWTIKSPPYWRSKLILWELNSFFNANTIFCFNKQIWFLVTHSSYKHLYKHFPCRIPLKKNLKKKNLKIGTHCAHLGSASAKRFSGSVKTLHSRDSSASFSRQSGMFCDKKKNTQKKLHRHARKSLVYEVSVSVGFIHARAVDLFVYGHSLLHSYMPDDMVSSIEHYSALPTKS